MNHPFVQASELERFCIRVLETTGLSHRHARTVSRSLVEADLRGLDSHGVSRLRYYADKLRSGGFNAHPEMRIVSEGPAYAVVDADHAPGAVAGTMAMDLCIEKARMNGVSFVSVCHGNHFGYAAFYTQMALEAGMVAFAGCNTPAKVAVFGGADPVLGTNPFSYAIPTGDEAPLLFDGATSTVARGKLVRAACETATGGQIPEGWALDRDGRPALTAADALEGTLLTFGEHKGSALSIMVEALSTLLSGAELSVDAGEIFSDPGAHQNLGFFFAAIDVSRFTDPERFQHRARTLRTTLLASKKRPGVDEILMPGEKESRKRDAQVAAGISMGPELWNDLARLQDEYEIEGGPFTRSTSSRELEL